ncbi:MAG TPA: sugar nucleotide-binding protein [Pseudomonadales bacterium]|nr:sugar nucleotide-binding protein [Pseudomonadales bacterium]
MKILLCGGESPLGKSLVYRLEQLPFPFIQLAAETLADISVPELESLLRDKQIVAIVNVQHLPFSGDNVGQHAEAMACQYVRNPETLAKAAATTGCFLLQLSDCQIFSGQQTVAYRETDEPDAVAAYGMMRRAGERAVMDACPRHLILRTGELFSSLGPNVLTNLLDAWRKGGSAAVSVRYQFCPTSVRDAARVIVALLQQLSCGIEPWGIYHYCGTDAVSYHDFARLVKQIIDSQPELNLVMDMREIAEGLPPLSWALDCSKIRETFGIKQHAWRAGLTTGVKRALLANASVIHTIPEGDNDGGCD